eukprot:CAMPEP_0170183078 /NCGR_PEP_ID=MMETSP0040_2-20121228/29549_1 /TAXON_ID=641309 /ORGANISM="Lotharella oceanica, Strain CCMP622" /LENGTH=88 /DNA_ID=CAMNT_0010428697 /DNA_START=138 /DNA_END=404 /DNA_ORIENTATION=-
MIIAFERQEALLDVCTIEHQARQRIRGQGLDDCRAREVHCDDFPDVRGCLLDEPQPAPFDKHFFLQDRLRGERSEQLRHQRHHGPQLL